jgi:hypothetical protein
MGQGRFLGLWTLWKNRPEFHTRKPLVQNSKQAFSQQNPQTLLSKTHPNYFAQITIDEKASRKLVNYFAPAVSVVQPQRRLFLICDLSKRGRAHLHIPSECRIPDKPRGICCFESFFKQEVP